MQRLMADNVGRTRWSARDPLVPLWQIRSDSMKADEGVARRSGGLPHKT